MNDSKKITLTTIIIFIIFIAIYGIYFLKKNAIEYNIGDYVMLKDGSTWHVVVDCLKKDDYITLLSDTSIDLNSDGSNNDTMYFNSTNYNKDFYSSTIGNYLINFYMPSLVTNGIEFGTEGEIRLITLDELLNIGSFKKVSDSSNFPIYNLKKAPNWLYGSSFGTYGYWWTMTAFDANDSDVWVVNNVGNIIRDSASNNNTNSVRPVIKILKSNL